MEKKDKGKSKKELELELDMLIESNVEQQNQLQQLSQAYQTILNANTNLSVLVDKYEETINLLTARLIETKRDVRVASEESR
jgi:hypothetical protein